MGLNVFRMIGKYACRKIDELDEDMFIETFIGLGVCGFLFCCMALLFGGN